MPGTKRRLVWMMSLLILVSLVLSACQTAQQAPPAQPTQPPAPSQPTQPPATAAPQDLLSAIKARGKLLISTDPAYPPQSELVENAKRPADSKCSADERTAAELAGFDIDVAVEIAKRLGVEPCFVTPDWTLITGGSWADRWDISVGSMTITPERMEPLYFSQPYYTTPAAFFVHKDNTAFKTFAELAGKKIGVCSGCTYESYLDGSLKIPGEKIDYAVKNAEIKGYDTDTSALQDLALGDGVRLDAVLTALPTGQGVIKDGLPLKQLSDPAYFEYLAAAIDKKHSKDPVSFVKQVTELIQQMHADGTLLKLSEKHYGLDLTTAASKFDVTQLKQLP
jgi:polar amino acid transport system substrate-binding protein